MSENIIRRVVTRLPFECSSHYGTQAAAVRLLCPLSGIKVIGSAIILLGHTINKLDKSEPTPLATEQELSDFLKSVEKRAFKRSVYHVRDEEAALDIVQDSMMKLAQHYGDKPVAELPMLFQRILSNTTLDWFRRRKTRNALFSNMSDFESAGDEGDFDLLETLAAQNDSEGTESAQDATERAQILRQIEVEIKQLPGRQREAFLMRYWEEMDVAETAAAMGCSEGSVKTHCSRAVLSLSKALGAKGIKL